MNLIQKLSIWAIPVLLAIIVHEVAHGWVASKLGDQTARLSGRLTLNPLKHIDPVGTILVPGVLLILGNFIFGWAKPVPVDARNMKNPRTDMAIVACAGPVSNFLMALFWGGITKIGYFLLYAGYGFSDPLILMGEAGIMINVLLGVLNCVPIPPLDGGRILSCLLPRKYAWYLYRLEPYGFIILFLLLLSGVWSLLMSPIVYSVYDGISNLYGI